MYKARGILPSLYWLGLEKSGNLYYWQDGTVVNNGHTSNADPCAWVMVLSARLCSLPAHLC